MSKRLKLEKDPFGNALKAHLEGRKNLFIKVHSSAASEDHIQVKYLFRDHDDWPELEKQAIKLCKGKILEIGAGAGSHALFLQNSGLDVTAVDISEGSVEVMGARGIKNIIWGSGLELELGGFDTILLLMNGIGIVESLDGLEKFLLTCFEKYLNPGGQLVFDSSDLVYLLNDQESQIHNYKESRYYGEVAYKMEFEETLGDRFHWLFIDFATLQEICLRLGFKAEKVFEDDHFAYLVKVTNPLS